MWDIKNWDINYLIIFSIANILYYILNKKKFIKKNGNKS